MALILSEEQVMLRDAARSFLAERAPVSHLRSLRDDGIEARVSSELWSEMIEMGWPAILVPEAHGGLGYGYSGIGIVMEETGRTLTPSPLLGTALTGVTALVASGNESLCADILPRVASGETLLALACDESPRHRPDQVATRAEPSDGGFLLNGRKMSVHDGHIADHLIVSARAKDGISLFLVPTDAEGVRVERYPVLDISAAANVGFDAVQIPRENVLGDVGNGAALQEHILDAARVGVSAELLGIAREAFERTMEYIKQRKQFGVPVGGFQALQHRAAQLYADIELCESLVLRALQVLDGETGSNAQLFSATKAKLCVTAHHAANEAIQMHGGIGMTDEFDIGFFLKRCQILEALYGDRYFHYDRYARLRGF